ncbi:MAG: hypothetical protein ACOZQL_30995, partial [Myxococcota bacterium]
SAMSSYSRPFFLSRTIARRVRWSSAMPREDHVRRSSASGFRGKSTRAGQSVIALTQTPRAHVLLDIGTVEDRLLAAQGRAPEFGVQIKVVLEALEAFAVVARQNIPD